MMRLYPAAVKALTLAVQRKQLEVDTHHKSRLESIAKTEHRRSVGAPGWGVPSADDVSRAESSPNSSLLAVHGFWFFFEACHTLTSHVQIYSHNATSCSKGGRKF